MQKYYVGMDVHQASIVICVSVAESMDLQAFSSKSLTMCANISTANDAASAQQAVHTQDVEVGSGKCPCDFFDFGLKKAIVCFLFKPFRNEENNNTSFIS